MAGIGLGDLWRGYQDWRGGPSLLDQLGASFPQPLDAGQPGQSVAQAAPTALSPQQWDTLGNFNWEGGVKPTSGVASVIKDWRWRPVADVQQQVGATDVPEHVQDFGRYMLDMVGKAKSGGLGPRDLVKAYTITRSSIQRTAQGADKLRERWPDFPGSGDKVRPEGAFAEWLLTPMGKQYLDAAEKGHVDLGAVGDAVGKLGGFGKPNDLIDAMTTAASLPGQEGHVGEMIAAAGDHPGKGVDQWRQWALGQRGIGPAKAGFIASLLGRGDMPTLDARQILLQTGDTTAAAQPYLNRSGGLGALQAVDRLARRQTQMGLGLPDELEPFRQHLTHHTLWDAYGGETTTHDDLMRAMRFAGVAGPGLATGAALSGASQDQTPGVGLGR